MASAIVLEGPPPSRRERGGDGCKCVSGGRNRNRRVLLCPVPKSKKHRSGWTFKGSCR